MSKSHQTDDSRFIHAAARGPRDEQQDAAICLSASEHGTALLVVSDGVGGQGGGRIASQKVTELAREFMGRTPRDHARSSQRPRNVLSESA